MVSYDLRNLNPEFLYKNSFIPNGVFLFIAYWPLIWYINFITIFVISGVKNICRDIKFMLDINTSIYYRLCWGVITPIFMTAILIYMLVDYKPLTYNDVTYPEYLYGKTIIWN